ncbi:MAG: hypothetical protein WC307_02015 [Candidatus Nanoarchaeia archaeon]
MTIQQLISGPVIEEKIVTLNNKSYTETARLLEELVNLGSRIYFELNKDQDWLSLSKELKTWHKVISRKTFDEWQTKGQLDYCLLQDDQHLVILPPNAVKQLNLSFYN